MKVKNNLFNFVGIVVFKQRTKHEPETLFSYEKNQVYFFCSLRIFSNESCCLWANEQ